MRVRVSTTLLVAATTAFCCLLQSSLPRVTCYGTPVVLRWSARDAHCWQLQQQAPHPDSRAAARAVSSFIVIAVLHLNASISWRCTTRVSCCSRQTDVARSSYEQNNIVNNEQM